MNRQIKIQNKKINYRINKSKRAKRLRIAVYCDASIVVTMPEGITETLLEKFLYEKSAWLIEKINYFKKFKNKPFVKNSKEDYLKNKNRALELVKERIEYFNKDYKFNKVLIKNQKTRWGSCSRKRNLNFNYKIIYLSKEMIDYIIVHELCHLKEFNHSRKFWDLVKKSIPNCLDIKRKLRKKELASI